MMRTTLMRTLALAVSIFGLTGCYEALEGVLTRGQDAAMLAGNYGCRNDKEDDGETVAISMPVRRGNDDLVYDVTLDKERLEMRVAPMAGDLFLLEARQASGAAVYMFARRLGNNGFDLLIADFQNQERPAALAATHGVTLESQAFVPRIKGTPERVRAFLLAHQPSDLRRTSSCRHTP